MSNYRPANAAANHSYVYKIRRKVKKAISSRQTLKKKVLKNATVSNGKKIIENDQVGSLPF